MPLRHSIVNFEVIEDNFVCFPVKLQSFYKLIVIIKQ